MADEERSRVPDAVFKVVDLALPGVNIGRPGDLLDEGCAVVEMISSALFASRNLARYDVRHHRRVILDLEVRRVAVGLLERGAVPATTSLLLIRPGGNRNFPRRRRWCSRRASPPPRAPVLVGIVWQVGVRAELGDQDTSSCAGEAEEQGDCDDPAIQMVMYFPAKRKMI